MIRFPNPGSDIPTFIRIFQTLYANLSDRYGFSLDDISLILTRKNLASSSGYVGEEALRLSTRKERTKDPLYNQSKMYSELFRSLGWISSSEKKALLFSFTFLGEHVATAKMDLRSIFEESILGINYPNQIIENKSIDNSRTFACILRAAYELGGVICRDEIILGPMNVDDINQKYFYSMIDYIKKIRDDGNKLSTEMDEFSKKTNITINTLRNYTRFPISSLIYCGWFEKERSSELYPNNRSMQIFKLTPYGVKKVKWLSQVFDFRTSDYNKINPDMRHAMIRLGFYSMLERANFDIEILMTEIARDKLVVSSLVENNRDILFSPYQTIKRKDVDAGLGIEKEQSQSTIVIETSTPYFTNNGKIETKLNQYSKVRLLIANKKDISESDSAPITKIILTHISKGMNNSKIVEKLFEDHKNEKKEVFYPLVADLFRILGFNCLVSRNGINYERWDAIIVDDEYSIPIEIKSPTEEEFISIKAIRQALENKIILLSRKSYKTNWETTSLVVGYNIPNERAEVSRLIEDIITSFKIKIGVIDFKSLLEMSVRKLSGEVDINASEIIFMEGIIHVENI